MNKGDLVAAVAKDLGGSKDAAQKAVNSVLENIKKNVKKGVNIIGFGSFGVSTRKARTGRNQKPAKPSKSKPQRTSVQSRKSLQRHCQIKKQRAGNPGSFFIKPEENTVYLRVK